MANLRRVNFISQQRIDTPDMRSVESAVSNDFDQLIQAFATGTTRGYVLRGFEISMAGAIGGAASGLLMVVDPGAIFHVKSSISGTFYIVPTGTPAQLLNSSTNLIVDGAFTHNAINYVGLEYERYIDVNTTSQVYLWNPTTKGETTKNVPRAQILRYRIKITSRSFASTVLPIAMVTTDSSNNVVSITDARWLFFREGQGGTSPDPLYDYWTDPAHINDRVENPSTSSTSLSPFEGGDKDIGTLKDWMDSVMSSFKEIKGTTYWYSVNSAGSIEKLREDLGNTITTGVGTISHSQTVAGLINWSDDIFVKVVGSPLSYEIDANPSSSDIALADDEAAYIDLSRDIIISPSLIFTNGNSIVTSVSAVAWTTPLKAGDWVKLGTDTDSEYYQIFSKDSSSQVTLTTLYAGASVTAKAKYAFGSYYASASPIGDARAIQIVSRGDVPTRQNIFWLFLRADNGGTIPRAYIHFLGVELEQGESQEIDSDIPTSLLNYIGTSMQGLNSNLGPQYVSSLSGASVPEITDLKIGDSSTLTSNQFFFINSSADSRKYYGWINKDGTGVDPAPLADHIGIEIAVVTGALAPANAIKLRDALNSTLINDFTAVVRANPNDDTVRVTNKSAGTCVDASNYDVGAPFAITVIQQGTGLGNYIIVDGENLTLSVKKLDEAFGDILASLDDPSYDELVTIVASGATPPTSLNGPVVTTTVIDLPNNSRLGSIPQYYTVGSGKLQIFLNGQYLVLDSDWSEVGSTGEASNSIEILQQLEIGDILDFRISGNGGAGSGGGPVGPQGPIGLTGPAGADALGGPVSISTKTSSYPVLNTDNVLLADCTSVQVDFTLPTPASAIGKVFFFKKIDVGSNAMRILVSGGGLIDGLTVQSTTTQYESFQVVSNGSEYYIL